MADPAVIILDDDSDGAIPVVEGAILCDDQKGRGIGVNSCRIQHEQNPQDVTKPPGGWPDIQGLNRLQISADTWVSSTALERALDEYRLTLPDALAEKIMIVPNNFSGSFDDDYEPFKKLSYGLQKGDYGRFRGDILSREYTFWPIIINASQWLLAVVHRESKPKAGGGVTLGNVLQIGVMDSHTAPADRTLRNRVVDRLGLLYRGLGVNLGAPPRGRFPWIPVQNDVYSCGCRAYSAGKETMDRLLKLHEAQTSYDESLWDDHSAWFNYEAVRAEMILRNAWKAVREMEYRARIAVELVNSVQDDTEFRTLEGADTRATDVVLKNASVLRPKDKPKMATPLPTKVKSLLMSGSFKIGAKVVTATDLQQLVNAPPSPAAPTSTAAAPTRVDIIATIDSEIGSGGDRLKRLRNYFEKTILWRDFEHLAGSVSNTYSQADARSLRNLVEGGMITADAALSSLFGGDTDLKAILNSVGKQSPPPPSRMPVGEVDVAQAIGKAFTASKNPQQTARTLLGLCDATAQDAFRAILCPRDPPQHAADSSRRKRRRLDLEPGPKHSLTTALHNVLPMDLDEHQKNRAPEIYVPEQFIPFVPHSYRLAPDFDVSEGMLESHWPPQNLTPAWRNTAPDRKSMLPDGPDPKAFPPNLHLHPTWARPEKRVLFNPKVSADIEEYRKRLKKT
ncbi:hypothetical protein F4778DRAFT_779808 [Xylariomycetidae sp. FL2044]|nr:hypothetical protein F4778DRAFT_779808 [Xylariomycetidae sp. FL2044]